MSADEATDPTVPDHGATTPGASRAEVRDAFRDWLSQHWDPELELVEWRTRLVDAGWMTPSWPRRWGGRDLPSWSDEIVASELRARDAPGAPVGVGMALAAPTVLVHGPDGIRARLLRDIVTGVATWCQLFSEPGAGSDLAGLTTHATLDGDRWIVSGQKVWTTSAHHADLGLLLARTDHDAPKHRGITCFALPMDQVGVEVRPLRQMNRRASFNEVFLDDAEIPTDQVIGAVGDGWSVARTTLAHERGFGALFGPRPERTPSGRAAREADAEAADYLRTYEWYPQRAGRPDLVIEAARFAGSDTDAVVRQRIVDVTTRQRLGAITSQRARAARALGRPPGAEGSIGKLTTSEVARRAAETHTSIAGAHGMLATELHDSPSTETDDVLRATVAEVLVSTPAQSIAGGTDEIQRNIVGEQVLGLPREPGPGRDVPFRELPTN